MRRFPSLSEVYSATFPLKYVKKFGYRASWFFTRFRTSSWINFLFNFSMRTDDEPRNSVSDYHTVERIRIFVIKTFSRRKMDSYFTWNEADLISEMLLFHLQPYLNEGSFFIFFANLSRCSVARRGGIQARNDMVIKSSESFFKVCT